MAQKSDPKDDRISELEGALAAANSATTVAEVAAQRVPALEAEIGRLTASLSELSNRGTELERELNGLRDKASGNQKAATVKGLDASVAAQLKVSCVLTNGLNNARISAVAGDVIVETSAFQATQQRLGSSVSIHPVSKEEFESAVRNGRTY